MAKESLGQLQGGNEAHQFVREAYNHGKTIAVGEEGVALLKSVGITSAPGVVLDKSNTEFSHLFVEAIGQHCHWTDPNSRTIMHSASNISPVFVWAPQSRQKQDANASKFKQFLNPSCFTCARTVDKQVDENSGKPPRRTSLRPVMPESSYLIGPSVWNG